MTSIEKGSLNPQQQLEERFNLLTRLVNPEAWSKSHVRSFKFSVEGVSTDEQRRESIKVFNAAIAAIRGANRLINSGGIVQGSELEWKRPLASDKPNACVEFTLILR